MLPIILLLLLTISVLYYKYLKHHQKWRGIDRIPGPPNYPFIGNIWKIALVSSTERIKFMNSLEKKYGAVYKLWQGRSPIVVCSNPESAEAILRSRINIEKGTAYDPLTPWLGTGLLTSGGSKWHHRRKLLTPTFHFSVLESFLPMMIEHSKALVNKLEPFQNHVSDWDICPFIYRFTLDVICETAMGLKLEDKNRESFEYLQSVTDISQIFMEKLLKPWYRYRSIYMRSKLYRREVRTLRILHNMSMKVIQKNRDNRREGNSNSDANVDKHDTKTRKAFLDLLLDVSEDLRVALTDEDIREEVDTFMAAGHDTEASAISSAIHLLSTHPEIQEKVAQELRSVFGDSDRDPTSEDLSKLKYLESVIKESHRLLPPVPIISRRLSESVTLGEHVVPAGASVWLRVYGVHRQEKYFPNPDEFNPNNFAPENIRGRHPFAFVPFSAGSRNCIGQKFAMLEEKVVLSSLLRSFEIESNQKMEDLGLFVELVLRVKNGVRVSISPRTRKG